MKAFVVPLVPSKRLKWFGIAFHGLTIMLFYQVLIGYRFTLAVLLVVLSALWFWRTWHNTGAVAVIRMDDKGELYLYPRKNITKECKILQVSGMVKASFVGLSCYTNEGCFHLILLPDSVDRDAFRRVKVWAMHGKKIR